MNTQIRVEHFVPSDIALRLALSLGVGLFVGFEREWSKKEMGVRSFAITCLLGTLSELIGGTFALVSLGTVGLLIIFANVRNLMRDQNPEITTSVSLVVTAVLGVLIGQGHLFTPIAAAILLTLILSLKTEFSTFAIGLRPEEIRSAVLLGLLGFVIYPVLPDRFLDRYELINPREAWVTVMLVAGIGFVNYVLLRIYGNRGLYYTALLGGLVNSTATVAELSTKLAQEGRLVSLAVPIVLLTVIAMFVRNLIILAIFAPSSAPLALWPMLAMAAGAAYFAWSRRDKTIRASGELKLSSPVSLRKVLRFGLLFLAIEAVGTLGIRFLGRYGFLIVSFIGGLASSASATAAAANMTAHAKLTPEIGAWAKRGQSRAVHPVCRFQT